ncbi:MAG: hypothetical protein HY590_01375 [Candidatus Omnitrophica bacterium]|nr:hypothetical protein [Candidatus Omnitrophota bacterium]
MNVQSIVQQLLDGDPHQIGQLTQDCGSCQRFVRQIRRKPKREVGWDDVPQELLERFSSQWHRRLFMY